MIFKTSKNHDEHLPKVGEDKEQAKEYFDKLNKKSSKNKKEKSVIKDAKKQYDKLRIIIKEHLKDTDLNDRLEEIFGYPVNLSETTFCRPYEKITEYEKRLEVLREADKIQDMYRNSDKKADKAFEKYIKKHGEERDLNAKKIIAEAYNDHMTDMIKDKSRKIYRHVHQKEIFDILKTGMIKQLDEGETNPDEGVPNTQSPPFKSWTLDKKHLHKYQRFRLESTIGDYNFQILKATTYPRFEKTLKDGQTVYKDNLIQQELRLEIGDGIPIKKNTLLIVPADFFSNMNKYLEDTTYKEQQILEYIKKLGLTVKVDE